MKHEFTCFPWRQESDGSWSKAELTAATFPRVIWCMSEPAGCWLCLSILNGSRLLVPQYQFSRTLMRALSWEWPNSALLLTVHSPMCPEGRHSASQDSFGWTARERSNRSLRRRRGTCFLVFPQTDSAWPPGSKAAMPDFGFTNWRVGH